MAVLASKLLVSQKQMTQISWNKRIKQKTANENWKLVLKYCVLKILQFEKRTTGGKNTKPNKPDLGGT